MSEESARRARVNFFQLTNFFIGGGAERVVKSKSSRRIGL